VARKDKDKEKAYQKAYYQDHKEEAKTKNKAYYQDHKEELNARSKAYYQDHKEEVKAKNKAYHEANKEELNARSRAYGANNRDECNALSAKKRAVKRQAILPSSDLKLIKNLYKQRADTSKKHGEEYHVDHIIPLSIGGAHHQDNMRIITAKENLKKHDQYIPELGGVWADNDLARETKKKLEIK
jgi:5-methylcytosine-specific restriction endonuclease McrA